MSLDNQVKPPTDGQWPNYARPASLNGTSVSEPSEPAGTHQHGDHAQHGGASMQGHGGHKWMMLLMCLPLVAIGLWQLFSGAGFGTLIGGLVCAGMMFAMHAGMGGSSHRH